MVKKELSQRYYAHYIDILNKPEDQPQAEAPPASPEDIAPIEADAAGEDAPPEANGTPAESPSLAEGRTDIPEVTPISLKPPPPQAAAKPEEKKGPEKKGLKKLCFIATAAYGSPLAQEVVLLQDFRDRYLAPHTLGEQFIQAYYLISPPLARKISNHKALKLLTRALLFPVIFLIKKARP